MCSRNCGCSVWLTVSTFIAIIVAGLFFLGLLPNVQIALFIILAIAVISLFLLINCLNSCCTRQLSFEEYGICILVGAIGSIIFSVLALSVGLATGNILSTILVGLAAFFFILTLASTVGLIISLLNVNSENLNGDSSVANIINNGNSCGCSNNNNSIATVANVVNNNGNNNGCNCGCRRCRYINR